MNDRLSGQKQCQREEAKRFHRILMSGKIPNRDGIAIDGGAHVGSWTVLMADNFKKVIAFEPCIDSYNHLVANTTSYNNIEIYNKALMDKMCNVCVFSPGRQTLTAKQVRYSKRGDRNQVRAIALDDLKLESCNFIKLDLEGAEGPALRGAQKIINEFKPYICIELNNKLLQRFGYSISIIDSILRNWGYRKCFQEDVDHGYHSV